jgi:hypothetical protein
MLNSISNIARRRVMSLAEAGRKDQDSFHQSGKKLRTVAIPRLSLLGYIK